MYSALDIVCIGALQNILKGNGITHPLVPHLHTFRNVYNATHNPGDAINYEMIQFETVCI